jgi:homocysteine S-methyltransferase
VAVGVNCCDAAEVSGALATPAGGLPAVVYPNSGERWHAGARRWSGPASAIAASVGGWVAGGARLVGGCCRVGPDQITQIARAVAPLRASGARVGDPA